MATQAALTLTMAKAQLIARLAVEAAPPQLSSIIRRPRRGVPRMLDTIAEEEAEAAVGTELPSYALLLRAAAASKTPPPRHSVVMAGGGSSARAETKVKRRGVVVVGNSASGEKRLLLAPAPAAKAAATARSI
ncbi:hypothetical protein ABZP36_006961 [Zizania latifolia]